MTLRDLARMADWKAEARRQFSSSSPYAGLGYSVPPPWTFGVDVSSGEEYTDISRVQRKHGKDQCSRSREQEARWGPIADADFREVDDEPQK